jgi:hypothetical protein
VGFVERAGIVAPLPHMSGRGMAGVEIGSVGSVGMLEGEKERIGPRGDDDQVDVVGQEAIAGQREAVDSAVLAEKVQVDKAAGIGFEDDPAPITSLGNVVRSIESDDTRETGHDNRKCGKEANYLKKTSRLEAVKKLIFRNAISFCRRPTEL